MNRIDVLQAALDAVGGRRYLELGVNDGACFHAIRAETRIGVDPRFAFRPPIVDRLRTVLGARSGTLYFPLASDEFFARYGRRLAPLDVVFVDGLHTHEQAYRDTLNALRHLSPEGVVVLHDCSPASAAAAAPTLEEAARSEGFSGDWNGDVYKAVVRLRTHPELRVQVLACDQGVGVVTRGVPERPLALTPEEIGALDYAELDRRREELLGLRPPADLAALLPRRG